MADVGVEDADFSTCGRHRLDPCGGVLWNPGATSEDEMAGASADQPFGGEQANAAETARDQVGDIRPDWQVVRGARQGSTT